MTQGKIERTRRSMKNAVQLENHTSPWGAETRHHPLRGVRQPRARLHEAIGNLTPYQMVHGRQRAILSRGEKIKRLTLKCSKKQNLCNAA